MAYIVMAYIVMAYLVMAGRYRGARLDEAVLEGRDAAREADSVVAMLQTAEFKLGSTLMVTCRAVVTMRFRDVLESCVLTSVSVSRRRH